MNNDTTLEISSKDRPEFSLSRALLVIPPLRPDQNNVALEAAMQSLVLDKRHPVALELAGTAERRSFIVRATSQTALDHVEALLRSQYPQIEIRALSVSEDPFRLEPYEEVSAVELVSGTASYLPLKTWQDAKQSPEVGETDPLLGLLAALSKLPVGTRAIAQLSLVPAAPDWSKGSLRKTVEHALEPERRARQLDMATHKMSLDGLSTPVILSIAILCGLFALLRPLIPAWVWVMFRKMMIGQDPHLSSSQMLFLVISIFGLVLAGVLVFFLFEMIRRFINPEHIYDMRMVAEKTSRAAYRVRLRLYAIGPKSREYWEGQPIPPSEQTIGKHANHVKQWLNTHWQQLDTAREQDETRQGTLLRLVAAYRQFHMASGAYFVPKSISPRVASRLLSRDMEKHGPGWPQGLIRSKHLLSVDALAALWHMPSAAALPELAVVEHRRARTLLIPPDVAHLSVGLPPIGYSEHGGYRFPFALSSQFFTAHTLIGGKSGEGKSTCIEHIAREAMTYGGLILIDPHGDLCEHVLQVVPAHRAEDVVLIDLADKEASVGINPLDVTLGRGRDKAISDLLKTLAHIWVSSWGPRMENAFEMSLRTLFEANKVIVAQDAENGPLQQYTLLDVLPLLTNENFCHAILQQIQDDYLHRWWREYYEPLTLMQQRDVINPVLTKVAKFESIIARRIIGQGAATLNFTQMIAERKIILLKLAKGVVGADVAALIGATVLGLMQITLEEQGTKEEQSRVRLPIILDEFQVLAGIDYGALAELRKYGATFFLATQSLEYLQKLDPLLLPTVLANVRQLMIFHMSAQDSETLYKELGVEQNDILNLDMHTCYVKLSAANRRQPTFSLKVDPPPTGDSIQAESIRTRCRVRYTCSIGLVDERLRDAMIRGIRLAPTSHSKTNHMKGRGPSPKGQRDRGGSLPGGHHESEGSSPKTSPVFLESKVSEPIVSPIANTREEISPEIPAESPHEGSMPGELEANASEPRRRRSRGRRGGKRRNKQAVVGERDSFDNNNNDFVDDDDHDDMLEMVEIQAVHKGEDKEIR
jgi:hypothetical protein